MDALENQALMTTEDEVEVSTFTSSELFRRADEYRIAERDSHMVWARFTDERRAVLCLEVRETLLRLAEHPEVWVPTSLEPGNGDWVKVAFRFQLDQLDEESIQLDMAKQRQRMDAVAELLEIAAS